MPRTLPCSVLITVSGVGALFDTDIDGDVGEDPNYMTLWFSQPSLGLPSKVRSDLIIHQLLLTVGQEYYEEESIVDLYRDVLERLLIALADEDDELADSTSPALAVHEERLRVWPPWPWPPWDPEDPDKPGKDKPINRTKEAPKLARQIIELEKKIANASLDL